MRIVLACFLGVAISVHLVHSLQHLHMHGSPIGKLSAHSTEKRNVTFPLGSASAVVVYARGSGIEGSKTREFWDIVSNDKWIGNSLLYILHQIVDLETLVVDADISVGATALFAANFANKVVGLERNAAAHRNALSNLRANNDIGRFGNAEIFRSCTAENKNNQIVLCHNLLDLLKSFYMPLWKCFR